ncbi:MAG TPA: TonB-dependent receptor [Candidatus Eisenbacteria bacterium]|nr:TonB-dependent receptor [Candidatus Eisenbacteria bacterium]
MMSMAVAVFISGVAWAGTTGQISGMVRDGKSGDPLGLVTISIPELKRGAVSDAQGNFFIVNLPAGKYTVRASLLGFVPLARQEVQVFPDFVTKLDFTMESTVLQNVQEVEVKAERPLIQKDVTGTTRFLSGDEIRNQPLRGYQDAVAQQAGVVNFKLNIDNEANNGNTLIIRGGRPNEVAYYVDGFSQQDPLTGNSTTLINSGAIEEVVVQSGGFNAEYGRINSGVVNVVTKEGNEKYFGSLEGVSDFLSVGSESRDNNIYSFSLGGPLVPNFKKGSFYFSGERKYNLDRDPSSITEDVVYSLDKNSPFADGILPANASDSWATVAKLTFNPTPLQTLKIGGTWNRENWQQYQNTYRFNLAHAPRFEDLNYSVYTTWNHSVSSRAYYEVKANYFTTERTRGDGVFFDDLQGYATPSGNPRFDPNEALFWYGPNDVDSDGNPTGEHVWDDFLHRKSAYFGTAVNFSSQMTKDFQFKAGGDYQKHKLRYYNHYFPTQLYDGAGNPDNVRDVDRYGYDALGNEIEGGETYTDTNANGSYDPGEPFVDSNNNGLYESDLDKPKTPTVASLYVQGKYERLGLVLNGGLRWDYLTPNTKSLRSESTPLDPDAGIDSRLQETDLQDSKVYNRLSPRLGVGFPVSDQTLIHVNYGKFFQQPNLQDLYVSYAFLEHKIRTGGYFVGFGNPNLKPEQTTAYELGLTHTPTDRSRIQATAYYKDVKDLVEITNIPSSPNSFSTYRNRDFATVKGLDLAYTLRRVGLVSMTASYSLSWAMGTGSVSQSQRNIAWTASEPPKISTPLAFDQRHKFSMNFDFRYDKGQGPTWGATKFLENAGLNILVNAASGTPYTPTTVYNEVTLAAVATQPIGPLNSRYGPWTFEVDAKLNKTVTIARQNLDLYVWVLNLFNRDNVNTVYTGSGSAVTTNFLQTADGQAFLDTNAGTYGAEVAAERFRLAEQNPNLYGIPRMVRFGARWSF